MPLGGLIIIHILSLGSTLAEREEVTAPDGPLGSAALRVAAADLAEIHGCRYRRWGLGVCGFYYFTVHVEEDRARYLYGI